MKRGITLIELLVVITILSILTYLGTSYLFSYLKDLKAFEEANTVYEDLKTAQTYALKYGGSSLVGGNLVDRRIFVVFDTSTDSYSVYLWEDANGNGNPDIGESSLLFSKSLNLVSFSIAQGVSKSACTNSGTAPSSPVTFQTRISPPCNNKPCIKFHPVGFIEGINGAVYMSYRGKAYAVSINKAGYIRFCKWAGNKWVTK